MQVYKSTLYGQPRLIVVSSGMAVVIGDDDGAGAEVTHFGEVSNLNRSEIRIGDVIYTRSKS